MERIKDLPKLSTRVVDAHKGDFGKILIVGGSIGMSGAAAVAGRAALRAGAGLVRLAVPKSVLPIVASIEPCYATIALPETSDGYMSSKAGTAILEIIKDNDVVAFGPGAGQSKGVRGVLNLLTVQEGLRLIVDADGLNCLAKSGGAGGWLERKQASMILTPHPGEMKRLWEGIFRETMPTDRTEQAAMLATRTDCVVVLKGAGTVVTDGKKVYVNTTGNPGMATGGSGDVLTGVIAAIAGGGMNNFDAAAVGVYIHGMAGDLAADKLGQISLIATDIIENLSEAFKRY